MKRTLHVFRWLILSFCAGVVSHTVYAQESFFDEGFGQHYWPAGDGTAGEYPVTSFFTDAVFLVRQHQTQRTLLFDNSDAPLLTAERLDPRPAAGVRLGAAVYEMDGWELELQGLILGRMDRERTFSAANGVRITPGVNVFPFDTAEYQSDFYGGEFNIRKRLLPQLTVLTGLRICTLEEELAIYQSTSTTTRMDAATDNNLFGGQIGIETKLLSWRRVNLFGSLKSGLYSNRMILTGSGTNPLNSTAVSVRVVDTELTTMGEAITGLEIPLGPHGSIRLGYQALWLQGVGLANDQDYASILSGGAGVNKSNSTYHGGFLGVELAF